MQYANRGLVRDNENLTVDELKIFLSYNPDTGDFTYIKANNVRAVGDTAGYINGAGYLAIEYKSKQYLLHRLAVLFMLGRHPIDLVDHINGIKIDNSWKNLREASRSENNRNRKVLSSSVSGIKGLSYKPGWHPRYQANVTVGSVRRTKSINLRNRIEEDVVKELEEWLIVTREELHKEFAKHA